MLISVTFIFFQIAVCAERFPLAVLDESFTLQIKFKEILQECIIPSINFVKNQATDKNESKMQENGNDSVENKVVHGEVNKELTEEKNESLKWLLMLKHIQNNRKNFLENLNSKTNKSAASILNEKKVSSKEPPPKEKRSVDRKLSKKSVNHEMLAWRDEMVRREAQKRQKLLDYLRTLK